MSNYEWERGRFKLPSAEYAGFRQAIAEHDKAHKERAFALTQECWKGLTRKQQTDPEAYNQGVRDFIEAKRRAANSRSYIYGERNDREDDFALADAQMSLRQSYATGPPFPYEKPKRVLAADMEYPTNRTTAFSNGDCSVTFDKDAKTVTWEVTDNNNAVERARTSGLGQAFHKRLNAVRWTHGTGGVVVGNNEHARDGDGVGDGGNFCSGAYGYLGIEQEPFHVRPFTNAKGERIEVETKMGRYGQFVGKAVKAGAGRVSRGVPAGGQFSTRGRGESGVRL